MSYTFEIEFSDLYNKLHEELVPHKDLYTKITKLTNWVKLKSGTKYKDVSLVLIYEPDFKHEDTNKLELTIWKRIKPDTYYITFRTKKSSSLTVRTKTFKKKDYLKILKLFKKHNRKAIEI